MENAFQAREPQPSDIPDLSENEASMDDASLKDKIARAELNAASEQEIEAALGGLDEKGAEKKELPSVTEFAKGVAKELGAIFKNSQASEADLSSAVDKAVESALTTDEAFRADVHATRAAISAEAAKVLKEKNDQLKQKLAKYHIDHNKMDAKGEMLSTNIGYATRALVKMAAAPAKARVEAVPPGRDVVPTDAEMHPETRVALDEELQAVAAERKARDAAKAEAVSRSLKADIASAGDDVHEVVDADIEYAASEQDHARMQDDMTWINQKKGAVAEGSMERAAKSHAEAQRVAKLEASEDFASNRAKNQADYEASRGLKAEESVEGVVGRVSALRVEAFSPAKHQELQQRFNEITDKMTSLKPWNIFQKRALQKEVEEVMRQMDMTLENYAELKRDLARAEHDAKDGDRKLRAVYEAEAIKLKSELAPYEEAIARAKNAKK